MDENMDKMLMLMNIYIKFRILVLNDKYAINIYKYRKVSLSIRVYTMIDTNRHITVSIINR